MIKDKSYCLQFPKRHRLRDWRDEWYRYHLFWLVNIIQIVFIHSKCWVKSNTLHLVICYFNIAAMISSFLYANFWHIRWGGKLKVARKLLEYYTSIANILFVTVSFPLFLLTIGFEAIEINKMGELDWEIVQESIYNICLFLIPVIHSWILMKIWRKRRSEILKEEAKNKSAKRPLNNSVCRSELTNIGDGFSSQPSNPKFAMYFQ
ncbi:unnamed protein product [Moneuplotes crassus]|uniref:Uncharacterized protein n=1 Tax=Euplotes crassus TaxID=5936 RepID=A0AAD1XZE1_EUPCR|nr:unnamed protein product [Moneuplotes crassus]